MPQEVNVPMPVGLDIGATYSLRVTALDANGALVSGVKIGATTITADMESIDTGGGGTVQLGGDWFLVPGPEA